MSQWTTAIAVAAWIPACDSPLPEDDAAFRSADAAEEDDDGEPDPSATIEEIHGGTVVGCKYCGSHWTLVGDVMVVHLVKKLGDGILDLTAEGKFFFEGGGYGLVKTANHIEDGDGYSLTVYSRSGYANKATAPEHILEGGAVLRLNHEKTDVDIRLQYLNNLTHEFEAPPPFE